MKIKCEKCGYPEMNIVDDDLSVDLGVMKVEGKAWVECPKCFHEKKYWIEGDIANVLLE